MKIIQMQCKKHSQKVKSIDEIKELIPKMVELCNQPLGKHYNGAIALAHCQVDHDNPKRFFVFADGQVVINPKITEKIDSFKHSEGCMSFQFRENKKIKRFKKIKVTYLNEKFEEITEEVEGLRACVFQHEIDHFNGTSIYCKNHTAKGESKKR